MHFHITTAFIAYAPELYNLVIFSFSLCIYNIRLSNILPNTDV